MLHRLFDLQPPQHKSWLQRYGLALFGLLLLTATREMIQPYLHRGAPFTLYFPLILLVGWFCGSGPAMLVTIFAAFSARFLFLPLPLDYNQPAYFLSLALFVFSGILISWLCECLHRAFQDRLRAEQENVKQQEWFQITLTSIADGVIATDVNGHLIFINKMAETLTGWTITEAKEHNINEIFRTLNEETRVLIENPIQKMLILQKSENLPESGILIKRDGKEIPIEASVALLEDKSGITLGGVVVFKDITSRRQAEASVRESEMRFRMMADTAPVFIWMADERGQRTYFNRGWLQFTGRSDEAERNEGWMEGIHPEDLVDFVRAYQQAIITRQSFSAEYRLRKSNGEYCRLLERAAPRFTAEGNFAGFVGSCLDITELHNQRTIQIFLRDISVALAGLRDFKETFAEVTRLSIPFFADWCAVDVVKENGTLERICIEHRDPQKREAAQSLLKQYPFNPKENFGPSKILLTGEAELLSEVNDLILTKLSHDQEHLKQLLELGLTSSICVPLQARGHILGVLTFAIADSGRRYKMEHLWTAQKIAEAASFAIDNFRLYHQAQEAIASKEESNVELLRDIDQRKEMEKALRESEKQYRILAETIPQMIWTATPDGFLDYYNQRWYEYTGFESDEDWTSALYPDEIKRCKQLWEHAIKNGQEYQIEYRLKRNDGVYRWHLGRALPIRDESGTILRWFGTCTDIEDQKQAQSLMEKAQRQLTNYANELEQHVSERTTLLKELNQEMEAFTYSVSHDLRTPLQFIQGFSEAILADEDNRLSPAAKDYLHRIIRATKRMETLMQDLLVYSRLTRAEVELQRVGLEDILTDVLSHHQGAIRDSHVLIKIDHPLPAVRAHSAALFQAISNLISNAIKFISKDRTPEIHIWAEKVDGKTRLNISDNGIGIAQEYHDRIFRIFERLHSAEVYPGTGIGLSLVRKTMERMGGSVGLQSTPGEGSRFWLDFPKD